MKLIVYKGFDKAFLSSQTDPPLLSNSIEKKVDVLAFDRSYRKQLDMELLYLKDNDKAWVTYEEYTLIRNRVDEAMAEDGLELLVYRNNLYPDYYPIPFDIVSPP